MSLGRIILLLTAVAGCRHAPNVTQATPPSALVGLVIAKSGFRDVSILDTSETLPTRDLRWIAASPWAHSARAQVEGALRDLRTHAAQRLRWDSSLVRGTAGSLASARPSQAELRVRTFFTISPLGFSADSTVAAVYWTYNCGLLCAGGVLSLYRREPGHSWEHWHSDYLWQS